MVKSNSTMAQQVAQAASDFQPQSIGHAPKAVTVVVGGETLAITLGAALTSRGTKPERRWAMSSIFRT